MWRSVIVVGLVAVALGACNSDSGRRALIEATLGTRLVIHVSDGIGGVPIGARVMLFPWKSRNMGTSDPWLPIGTIDLYGSRQGNGACLLAQSAIGTEAGIIVGPGGADIRVGVDHCDPSPAIPFGVYRVVAWHGIDYERWEGIVDLTAARSGVKLDIALERAWTVRNALAADLHVHAAASPDSAMPNRQRVLAQVAAGIQVVALSNHNVPDSAQTAIEELALGGVIAALPSLELSSLRAHLGIYPVPLDREVNGSDVEDLEPDDLLAYAHTFPRLPIIQLNHPRFRATAMYDYYGWDGKSWPPGFPVAFDAVEVINGFTAFNATGDRRLDDSVRDLYTLVDHGHPVAAIGNSDTHDFNWVADGVARTFVYVPRAQTSPFDQNAFISAIRAHHTEATTGPYLDVSASTSPTSGAVGPGALVAANAGSGEVWLEVTVYAARFVVLDRLRITVGGGTTQEIPLTHGLRTQHWAGVVHVGSADTWIGVTADGDTPLPIEQTGTYQRDKWARPGDTPFAVISPILVDADGDGRWHRGDTR